MEHPGEEGVYFSISKEWHPLSSHVLGRSSVLYIDQHSFNIGGAAGDTALLPCCVTLVRGPYFLVAVAAEEHFMGCHAGDGTDWRRLCHARSRAMENDRFSTQGASLGAYHVVLRSASRSTRRHTALEV